MAASNRPWTDREVDRAVKLCKESATVTEAVGRIRVALRRNLSLSNLREVLARHGKPAPRDLVRPADPIVELAASIDRRRADRELRDLRQFRLTAERNERAFTRIRSIPEVKINASRQKSGKRQATPLTLLSDWHVGEVVTEEETLGKNHYDIAEARRRAGNFWDNVFWLRKDAARTQSCDDHILAAIGDLISGAIHPELSETNEILLMDQVSEAAALIMPGLRELSKQCRRVLVPCVGGNHGRITDKSRHKTGWANSLETMLYRSLRDRCTDQGLGNVEFFIPRAENMQIDVLGYRLQMQHGTQFRAAGGIGGILVPLVRACTRMQAAVFAHYFFFGHFHQASLFEMCVVNGSLIGDSAYSRAHGMSYREPEQVNCIIDARRGLRRFDPVSVK